MQCCRACADVGLFAAVDLLRLVERLTAFPESDDEGVAGLCHGAGTPVAGYQQRVFVYPGDVLFGGREDKAGLDELAGLQVELAECFGIFATCREGDEAQSVAWVEAVETLLNPFFIVLFGK